MGSKTATLKEMQRQTLLMPKAEFAEHFDCPYLLVEPLQNARENARAFRTVNIQLDAAGGFVVDDPAANAKDSRDNAGLAEPTLFAVRKEGVADAQLVTIGRTNSSDIVLPSPAISKLHAYFSRDPVTKAYSIADNGSTNGTVVEGKKLDKNQPVLLKGGETIELAERFSAKYITPEMLFDFVRSRENLW